MASRSSDPEDDTAHPPIEKQLEWLSNANVGQAANMLEASPAKAPPFVRPVGSAQSKIEAANEFIKQDSRPGKAEPTRESFAKRCLYQKDFIAQSHVQCHEPDLSMPLCRYIASGPAEQCWFLPGKDSGSVCSTRDFRAEALILEPVVNHENLDPGHVDDTDVTGACGLKAHKELGFVGAWSENVED